MAGEPIAVIGIGHEGPSGLSPAALAHIAQARVLAGGKRHLAFFPDWTGEKLVIDADLQGLVERLKATYRQQKTVVLASGDPLFYGIGRLLLDTFPKDELVFLPQVSSVQLAFARIKESWHDACVVSLHGRPMTALLPALRQGAAKIAVLTDAPNHPAAIAGFLSAHGLAHYTLWVCEELGGPGERVTCWTPESIQQHTFSSLNVTILLRHTTPAASAANDVPLLGIPEEAILHRQGMITKRDIRLLTLGYLTLRPGDVLWDIGAGSGSVSLEAARLSATLEVFALEKSAPAYEHVMHNVGTFALPNVHPVLGEAPAALAPLPDPDAVFIGGSGGQLEEIIAVVVQRLKPGGRLVMNCITLENFSLGWDLLRRHTLQVDTTAVQLSYAQPLGKWHRLEADSPIFILRATKP